MFNLRIKTIQTKESYYEITLGVDARGGFLSRYSEKNWKNYRKTTAPKYLFNRAAGLQIFFNRRLLQQLAQSFNDIWSSKKI